MEGYNLLFLLLGGLVGGVLVYKAEWALPILLFLSLAIGGTVTYFFPRFGAIRWGVSLVSYALLIRALGELLLGKSKPRGTPPFFWCFVALLFVISLSTAMNQRWTETLVASKNFFEFWSIPVSLYYFPFKKKISKVVLESCIWIAVLAVPICIVQYKYFPSIFPGDSVTGTFGGTMMGGGPNAAFSIFCTFVIGLLLARASAGLISKFRAVLMSIWLMIPILLANAKAVFLFLIILFIDLFWSNFKKNTAVSIMFVFTGVFVAGAVGVYHYKNAYKYNQMGYQPKTFEEYLNRSLSSVTSKNKSKYGSRIGSIYLWFDNHSIFRNPAELFIGHGIGSAKYSGVKRGHVAEKMVSKYGIIGNHVVSRLLWDIGLIGLFIYLLLFILAYYESGRIIKQNRVDAKNLIDLKIVKLTMVFFILTTPYQLSLLNIQAFNAFSMFMIGLIAFWSRAYRLTTNNLKINVN